MPGPDLEHEQRYIDHAYRCLDRMRARSEELLAAMKGADPDLEWALGRRVRALADNPRALCFGRIDAEGGRVWYIGRRHVEDAEAEPVVVEWRAPVALPFYRASWKDPMGLARRRQFVVDGRNLLSVGDDLFGAGVAPPVRDAIGVRGRDALLVELERARSGEMLDIVATIQPEQDEVIRAPAGGILAVQGGPGSGKTAVGLHRAAFLLYGDDAMARANVLVVGPNRTFLRYIAQVLPSLGEHAVVQTTLADLVPEVKVGRGCRRPGRYGTAQGRPPHGRRPAPGPGPAPAARPGRPRGQPRPAAARGTGQRGQRRGGGRSRRRLPYAAGRDLLRDQLVVALVGRLSRSGPGWPPTGPSWAASCAASPALKDGPRPALAVGAAGRAGRRPAQPAPTGWPAAAAGVLDEAEQRLLLRRRGRAWTPADAPLVDEAKDLIAGQSRTYGHAIADEAQDLSPMQLRMLARRCPSGSMTLLGDLAQGIGVWAHDDWRDLTQWLPTGGGREDGGAALRLPLARSGARAGQPAAARSRPPGPPDRGGPAGADRSRPAARWPRRDCSTRSPPRRPGSAPSWPTVAVIVPAAMVAGVEAALRGAGLDVGEATRDGLGRRVTVVAAEAAKGLEFDAVVVVEPAEIAAAVAGARGLRLLYVALTRPTQHLSIVTTTALPAALAS